MAKQAASEERLGVLHTKLTETLIEAVQDRVIEDTDAEGVVHKTIIAASPSALAVAAKFLKDNSIFANPEANSNLDDLKSKLRDRGRLPSSQDMKDAVDEIAKGLLQ